MNDVAEYIRSRGYRVTPQRVIVYEVLCEFESHPTALTIYERARERDPTISLATVYKVLQLFIRLGLVKEMGFRDGSTRYDSKIENHVNLICLDCGRVYDFEIGDLAAVKSAILNELDFLVSTERLEMDGLCSDCRRSGSRHHNDGV